jgi:hypothetical protein
MHGSRVQVEGADGDGAYRDPSKFSAEPGMIHSIDRLVLLRHTVSFRSRVLALKRRTIPSFYSTLPRYHALILGIFGYRPIDRGLTLGKVVVGARTSLIPGDWKVKQVGPAKWLLDFRHAHIFISGLYSQPRRYLP